jgi:hypothetical protein
MNVWLSDDGTRLMCNAFALCDRPAAWATPGPVGGGDMGMVPVCQRCADRLGMTELHPYELTVGE